MPGPTSGPRRAPRTTWRLRQHRVAVLSMRAILRLRRRPRSSARPSTKVTILLVHAWGMGGTIRTMLGVAGRLAERYEVEVISVWRKRDDPFFPFPPGVTVTAVDDRRPRMSSRTARGLRRFPGSLLHPSDRTAAKATLWTDVQLARRLWSVRSGILIGTRPALNLLVSQVGGGPALVATEHAPFRIYNRWLKREIRRRYPTLDAVVVLSETERPAFEELLGGATQVHVIPNAVPELAGGRARLDRPVIVTAGRLVPVKGYDRLIRAFSVAARAHPEWRLRICGGGGERRALRALIGELGLKGRVQLVGAVAHIERELEAASIFALSSRLEGIPLALLEAMSKGLAVASFDCPTGPREVIEHGVDGLLVANGDEQALGRALVALIEDEALRRRLGEGAIRKAEAFGQAAVGARWEALVAALAAGGATSTLRGMTGGGRRPSIG